MKRKLFFGEYLIQQGLISEEDMLQALAEQKRLTPSFEKKAIELGLLNMKQVFAILTRQASSDLSFAEIAAREQFLEQSQVDFIERALQEQRLGVGEVLVQLGRLEMPVMEEQLGRFHEAMLEYRQLEAVLLRVELFKRLDAPALRTLSSIAIHLELDAGVQLTREGESADSLFAVVSGYLRVTKNNPSGRGEPIYLCNLGPNEIAGEACIFGNARRSANVDTESAVELLKFERADFIRFLRDHPIGAQGVFVHIINGLLHKLEYTSFELSRERQDGLTQGAVEDVFSEMVG